MPRLHLVADVIKYYKELIKNWPVRPINANNFVNRRCLQRLVSVIKFIAERGLAFGDDENVVSPRYFFQRFSKLSSKFLKR